MRHPSKRGAISRTMVSTSGSSGTLDFPPGDVTPPRLPLEGNTFGGSAAGPRRERNSWAEAGDVEHPATRGPQFAALIAGRAGVKDDDIVAELVRLRKIDGDPFLRAVRIAARGEHRGDRGALGV